MQSTLIATHFKQGERVEVIESAPCTVTGFGRIECQANARPGWYYVRFPQGELELVQWVFIGKAAG